jgi:membrane protein implicated in regulation of membrane protease activity
MANSTIWWLLGGLAVGAELITGTFYLLMVAVGLAAAALAAHAGAGITVQLVVAALVGGGAVALWHLYRSQQPAPAAAAANRDVNLDIGETVHVELWRADGTAAVKYRGAEWTVVLEPGAVRSVGQQRVKEVLGNRLVVEPV